MVNHIGTKVLETERLLLRRFTFDDAQMMFDNWASDDDVMRYLKSSTHQSIQETKEAIGRWVKDYDKGEEYFWAIVVKDINEPIGHFVLRKPLDVLTLFYHDMDDTCFEIGYVLSKKFWGKNIAAEAAKTVLQFAFNEVRLQRIVAVHHGDNENSGKVLLKSGLQFDGSLMVPVCKDPSIKVKHCFYSMTPPPDKEQMAFEHLKSELKLAFSEDNNQGLDITAQDVLNRNKNLKNNEKS